jgi:hypothetical protein
VVVAPVAAVVVVAAVLVAPVVPVALQLSNQGLASPSE